MATFTREVKQVSPVERPTGNLSTDKSSATLIEGLGTAAYGVVGGYAGEVMQEKQREVIAEREQTIETQKKLKNRLEFLANPENFDPDATFANDPAIVKATEDYKAVLRGEGQGILSASAARTKIADITKRYSNRYPGFASHFRTLADEYLSGGSEGGAGSVLRETPEEALQAKLLAQEAAQMHERGLDAFNPIDRSLFRQANLKAFVNEQETQQLKLAATKGSIRTSDVGRTARAKLNNKMLDIIGQVNAASKAGIKIVDTTQANLTIDTFVRETIAEYDSLLDTNAVNGGTIDNEMARATRTELTKYGEDMKAMLKEQSMLTYMQRDNELMKENYLAFGSDLLPIHTAAFNAAGQAGVELVDKIITQIRTMPPESRALYLKAFPSIRADLLEETLVHGLPTSLNHLNRGIVPKDPGQALLALNVAADAAASEDKDFSNLGLGYLANTAQQTIRKNEDAKTEAERKEAVDYAINIMDIVAADDAIAANVNASPVALKQVNNYLATMQSSIFTRIPSKMFTVDTVEGNPVITDEWKIVFENGKFSAKPTGGTDIRRTGARLTRGQYAPEAITNTIAELEHMYEQFNRLPNLGQRPEEWAEKVLADLDRRIVEQKKRAIEEVQPSIGDPAALEQAIEAYKKREAQALADRYKIPVDAIDSVFKDLLQKIVYQPKAEEEK